MLKRNFNNAIIAKTTTSSHFETFVLIVESEGPNGEEEEEKKEEKKDHRRHRVPETVVLIGFSPFYEAFNSFREIVRLVNSLLYLSPYVKSIPPLSRRLHVDND